MTGRPSGTRARCRCGTLFELPRTAARVLACPQCGGNVAATSHACEFCGAHLLVKACPRCFERVFHAARHCSLCGVALHGAALAAPDGDARRRRCPRCDDSELIARLVGDVLLDECPACQGVYMDRAAFERTLEEREPARLSSLLGPAGADELAPSAAAQPPAQGPLYIRCPDCANVMNRQNFASISGVIIDLCSAHGVWFDANELQRIILFTMQGGLERARARRADRVQPQHQRAMHTAELQLHRSLAQAEREEAATISRLDNLLTVIWNLLS